MAGKHLHFDCYSGVSGDMTLGALVDLGVPVEAIERELKRLPMGPFALRAEKLMRQGMAGTRVHVEVEEEPKAHRHLRHVVEIVEGAEGLSPRVVARAKRAFQLLAEAEAHVHGSTPEKIHFHEVGAKDAILDVTGAMIGVELLGAESFSCSPITVGSGTGGGGRGAAPPGVGRGRARAPAAPLRASPGQAGPIAMEMATPTGVAIVRTLLEQAGVEGIEAAGLRPEKIGYGGGTREVKGHANYLRLWLCESPGAGAAIAELAGVERDSVLLLACEIDDMTPEGAGWLMERLLEAGALDAHFMPVQMKKNRPGVALRVVARPEDEGRLAALVLRETPTLGVRREIVERWKLGRRAATVDTPAGPVEVKLALWDGKAIKAAPEYESCKEAARRSGRPLAEVYELARRAAADFIGR